ncbi:MAG: ABC transporter permease, partial [Planctomycetota bacterium]
MSEAVFRAILRLYPPDFRERYGAELMECLRQDRWALGRHPGAGRLLRFWAHTLIDALASVVKVRTRRIAPQPADDGSSNGGDPTRGPGGRRSFVEETVQDARYAVRALSKQPGFALVVAGVLGLGIGASTTLFSAVNGVLLRPLPYPEQERLVFLGSKYPQGTGISQMSVPELMDVMDAVSSVDGYAASRGRALDLMTGTGPERVALSEVTPDYFRILGAMPALGPGFSEEDYSGSGGRVIMLGDGLWRRRFGGDPDIIGRAVLASDGVSQELNSYTIVGVLPPGFQNPPPLENPFSRLPPSELWAPLPLNGASYATSRTNWTVRTVARLGEGASLETLGAELQALERSLVEAYPEVHTRRDTYLGLGARPLLHQMVGSRRLDLLVLLGATGLLLLLACANVAGLLVARSLDRGRELGLRIALGAGRVRLLRQLLTESLVLALLGGGVGVVMAFLGTRAFRVLGPADFP